MVCLLLLYKNFNSRDLTLNESRTNCPTGKTSIFQKAGECFVGYKQYCCPDPQELTAYNWVGGSGGEECANAVCSATELEVDRAQFGGSQLGGCSCKYADPVWQGNKHLALQVAIGTQTESVSKGEERRPLTIPYKRHPLSQLDVVPIYTMIYQASVLMTTTTRAQTIIRNETSRSLTGPIHKMGMRLRNGAAAIIIL